MDELHPRSQGLTIVTLESFEAVLRSARVFEQMASDTRYVEHVVAARLPMFGRPIYGFGNNGRNAFGNAVGILLAMPSFAPKVGLA